MFLLVSERKKATEYRWGRKDIKKKKKKNFKSLRISDLREKFGPYTHCHTEPEPPKCNPRTTPPQMT